MFDDNGINIPFPQIVLNQREKEEKTQLKETSRKEAQKFVDEQKALTKNIEDEEVK